MSASSGKTLLREVMLHGTRKGLEQIQPDGSMGAAAWSPMVILPWAICYSEPFTGNTFHRDPGLLDAILRVGDYNSRSVDDRGNFSNSVPGWDEWRMFAWMEAMEKVRGDLDAQRLREWTAKFVGAATHIMDIALNMETFDGGIPNHGIWGHAFLYRVGMLYGRKDFTDMASLAFSRILASQTPDGCFREFQSAAGMQGTPVTGYNMVSAMAVNLYYGYSRDPAALKALDQAWHWWYDFLFPDGNLPSALDCRQAHDQYAPWIRPFVLPAFFCNQPEGRRAAQKAWRSHLQGSTMDRERPFHGLGFISLQYDQIEESVEPQEPAWPEYRRMIAEEACIRRRHGWTAILSGITNYDNSNYGVRLWALERQDCVSLFHKDRRLLIGCANSLMDGDFSTFVFYHNGAAHYLHNKAYLKSTPPLDTLLLRYGENIGAVSVDTSSEQHADITFSLHGEKGKRSEPGIGHPCSAMGAKAHLPLVLNDGDTVRLGDRTWVLGPEILRVRIAAGQTLDLGGWSVAGLDCPWEFRWPVWTKNPYSLFEDDRKRGLLEVILFTKSCGMAYPGSGSRATATFRVAVKSAGV